MIVKLGKTIITRIAQDTLNAEDVQRSMTRHENGDWGDMPISDKNSNDVALLCEDRIVSSYADRNGAKFYIITEADRSITTVLLPSEY